MRARIVLALLPAVLIGTGVAGQRGGGSSFEISGVTVDVAGRSADEARYGGWRLAQRKAWGQLTRRLGLGNRAMSDGALDQIVAGVIVENEQIGPNRYIARLGIQFDRARTSALLGIADTSRQSLPMLVIPVQDSGGVQQAFEQRTPWAAAWARFRTADSTLDYLRPGGNGPDAMLLTYGQVQRRGRTWWRTLIDQYGASDVLVPIVRLSRQWPGGPIVGVFEARHGPDDELIGSVSLRVANADGLPQLLDAGVKRLDAIYGRALASGALVTDPAMSPPPQPVAIPTAPVDPVGALIANLDAGEDAVTTGTGTTVTVQYDSPSASSVASAESALRGIGGVRSATTTSLALGGVSLMRVQFDGDPDALRAALEARGFLVSGAGSTLRIRRAPQLQPPTVPVDDRPTG